MMRNVLFLPTMLDEERLYRFTYAGTSGKWEYAYDLTRTEHGYETRVTVGVPASRVVERVKREDLRALLVATTRAMRDLTSEQSDWEPERTTCATMVRLRMHLQQNTLWHEDFGGLAGRIIGELPRLREATITAYYQPGKQEACAGAPEGA